MRYLVWILFSFLGFTACNQSAKVNQQVETTTVVKDSSSKVKSIPATKLIIPGKFIGQTQINENGAKVFKFLGRPDAGDAAMGKSLSVWYANHDTTGYQTMVFTTRQMGADNGDSKVKQIRITSPWFSTAEGVHVGSTLQQVKQHYTLKKTALVTQKAKKYTIYKADNGIAFEVNKQDVCCAIIVFDPAFQPGQTYLPFYDNIEPVN
jgi:hypothetical protein